MLRILIAVCAGLAVSQLALFLTTIYLHRALAHRALRMQPWLAMACRVLLWITVGIRARQWVAVHRKHHAFTDVDGDPHSPVVRSYLAVQFGNVAMYRRVANDDATVARYARDLSPDRWDRLLFDHSLVGLSIGTAVLGLVLGWRLALLAAAVHVVAYIMLSAAVNAVGHRFGTRPRAGFATNSQWLAWLTAGEGLHNNHHAAPTSAHLALAKGEIDPSWWAIRTARRFGWLSIRHDQPKLAPGDSSAHPADRRKELGALPGVGSSSTAGAQ